MNRDKNRRLLDLGFRFSSALDQLFERLEPAAVLFLLLACKTPDPAFPDAPREQPPVSMTVAAPTTRWQALDALGTATFSLPPSSFSPKDVAEETFDGTFRLDETWEEDERRLGRLKVYTHPLPFPEEMTRPNYPPRGARLFLGNRELSYINSSADLSMGGWFVDRGRINLLSIEAPEEPPLLKVEELASLIRGRNLSLSGLSPAEFVSTTVTVDRITRPTLHVPAPGSISFPVLVPADASLDFGVALEALPLLGESNGARAVVTINGENVWDESLVAGRDFVDARVSLAKWAGQTVTLAFASETAGDPLHDYVMFSTPTVSSREGRAPRRVVVIGIDTLRYDTLSAHGYVHPTTPELDSWAENAVIFENARAPAPRTRPSFRTALTGRDPLDAIHARTMADFAAAAGYRTAGFAANIHLVPRFGFNEGFEHWDYENGAAAETEVARATAWMNAHQDEDVFVFVHIMDPHTNYNAPEPFNSRFQAERRPKNVSAAFNRWEVYQLMATHRLDDVGKRYIRGLYDGEVAYTSATLGGFLRGLDALPGQTLTAVISDHGEEFWDHDGFEHNHTLYDELLHVVFWLRPPGGWGGGPHRITAPVGLVDLAATLSDLGAFPPPPGANGVSLRPFVDAGKAGEAAALEESLSRRPQVAGHLMFNAERWAVVLDGWKYLLETAGGTEEVYDLRMDPQEQDDLVDTVEPARLEGLRAALSTGTGWPMVDAWRFRTGVQAQGNSFKVRFDAPVAAAAVMDPESVTVQRANLEWGERPPIHVEDVGSVHLSADKMEATFLMGAKATNQVFYVTCAGTCPEGTLYNGQTPLPLKVGSLSVPGLRLKVTLGKMLLPTRTEADMLALPADWSQDAALHDLGYLHSD